MSEWFWRIIYLFSFRTEFHPKATWYQRWQGCYECAFSDRRDQQRLFELVKPWALWCGKPTISQMWITHETLIFSLHFLLIDGGYLGFSLNESVSASYKWFLKGKWKFSCFLKPPYMPPPHPSTLNTSSSPDSNQRSLLKNTNSLLRESETTCLFYVFQSSAGGIKPRCWKAHCVHILTHWSWIGEQSCFQVCIQISISDILWPILLHPLEIRQETSFSSLKSLWNTCMLIDELLINLFSLLLTHFSLNLII